MILKIYTYCIQNIKFVFSHLPFVFGLFVLMATGGCSNTPAAWMGEEPSEYAAPSEMPSFDFVTPAVETPTLTPVPTNFSAAENGYSADAAAQLIRDQIVSGKYDITLLSDSFVMDSAQYYTFVISKNGNTIEPLVLVGKELGDLWCISGDNTVSDISNHPLYHLSEQSEPTAEPQPTAEPLDSENEKEDPKDQKNITTEEALAIFRGLTSEQTGLSQLLDHYFFYIPEQTEEIMDHRCYAILVYSSVQDRLFLDAKFYMTLDGSTIYKQAHSSEDLEIFYLK